MQIQVNTDNHTVGGAGLMGLAEGVIERAFVRFRERITRVEVYLTDENGSEKSGDSDKRCVMEARLSGLQPITVNAEGSNLEKTLERATEKLEKTFERTLGRLDHVRGRIASAGDLPV